MKSERAREQLKLVLILFWLIFTVTFAIWWFKFSFDHIGQLSTLQPDRSAHWERQKRMVLWEGSTWLVLLALGGGALVMLAQREKSRARRIREFFASFSHEVKTSLASLRVQAESLQDELGKASSPVLDRLVGDTVRLQLQLENSLFLSSEEDLKLYVQALRLDQLIERTREQWPNLEIELSGAATVNADERALRTILSNLVQNALVHGKARRVRFEVAREAGRVRLTVKDDGRGFEGDVGALGVLFHRPRSTSGSGLGLYISRMLARKMGGEIRFESSPQGFQTDLWMQEAPR